MRKAKRFAFVGFRHSHILDLFDRVQARSDCEIVASCESDMETRDRLQFWKKTETTYFDFEQMLRESDADIIAIGDVYARRGELAIAALRYGKHVISDKPICTSQKELDQITQLCCDRNLSVGCQFDLVEAESIRKMKAAIQGLELGCLCTISISAQHPLRLGSRASWYFEADQHGGTINDIGIHVFDLIPWLTGQAWDKILFAREWNAKALSFPHFKDCAQFYALTESGVACFADVSYLAPDILGYDLPQYWRITAHGTAGMAEVFLGSPEILIVSDGDNTVEPRAIQVPVTTDYLNDFLEETIMDSNSKSSTERAINASRWALKAQSIARMCCV